MVDRTARTRAALSGYWWAASSRFSGRHHIENTRGGFVVIGSVPVRPSMAFMRCLPVLVSLLFCVTCGLLGREESKSRKDFGLKRVFFWLDFDATQIPAATDVV